MIRTLGIVLTSALLYGCATSSPSSVDAEAAAVRAADDALRTQALQFFGVLPDRMPDADNDTPERIALGKKLYMDVRLSANDSQSCNSCHNVLDDGPGVDNLPTSPGADGTLGGRNSPTSLNAGFHLAQFWDGRSPDLQDQAKGPILNPVEMAMPSEDAVIQKLLKTEYPALFAKAFPDAHNALTYDNLAEAIAAFERTLITRDRFDAWQKGDATALNAQEKSGLETFVASGCIACHSGPLLGGAMYQKMGLVQPYSNEEDKGRFDISGDTNDMFVFKVPSLRNVTRTGPYFHDGAVTDLSEAVRQMAWMQLGRDLSDQEVSDIVVFLGSVSGKLDQ